LQARGVLNIAL